MAFHSLYRRPRSAEISMKMFIWLVLFVIVGGIVVYLASDEFTRAGLVSSNGYIDSGARFGIYVGMPLSEARRLLASRGLNPDDLTIPSRFVPPHTCLHRKYPPDHDIEAWADRSWRRGTICLSSTQGKVASVSWHFDSIPAP